MNKYIDAEKLKIEIERLNSLVSYESKDRHDEGLHDAYKAVKNVIASLQQEPHEDLTTLINEAISVAKRIVDRNSFYNSLPQNLRNKYTSEAWREILEALSTMKIQEQPDVDLGQGIEMEWDSFNKHIAKYSEGEEEVVWLNWLSFVDIANYFYELGKNSK